ncbi:MAG: winged helix-turn-helix domain-containing protein [Halolamina sp.]
MQEANPTDALAVLGNETRVAILRTLADAEEPLPFSELRRRAEIHDAGRFNYHLSKLREYFVREIDGGYALREAGSRVVTAAGVAPRSSGGDVRSDSVDDDSDTCPVCGAMDCERWFHVHLSTPW